MRIFVEGIGILAPGLEGWPATREVLAQQRPYQPSPISAPPVGLLPPAERRRAGLTVQRLGDGCRYRGTGPGSARSARNADGVRHVRRGRRDNPRDLAVLATEQREVSPTRFHNSVHNASSGYWALATASRAPSISLSAYDDSFAAGLLEAAVQVTVHDRPVTLIAYDVPYPPPLHAARPIAAIFGIALVLAPHVTDRTLASLTVAMADFPQSATAMLDPELERLRLAIPAARALPLLAASTRRRWLDPSERHRRCGGVIMTLRLDRAGIAALIPHEGSMCLLDAVLTWDVTSITCVCVQPSVG